MARISRLMQWSSWRFCFCGFVTPCQWIIVCRYFKNIASFRNVGNQITSDMASHHRRTETSAFVIRGEFTLGWASVWKLHWWGSELIPWRRFVQGVTGIVHMNERGTSLFHRAFFNSVIDKHQRMHFFTFKTLLV